MFLGNFILEMNLIRYSILLFYIAVGLYLFYKYKDVIKKILKGN